MPRYSKTFETPDMTCDFMNRNPRGVPIIDHVFGCCVAVCDSNAIAERIINLLNMAYEMEMEDDNSQTIATTAPVSNNAVGELFTLDESNFDDEVPF